MNKLEVWKDVENYPNYQISNFGNVKSKERYTKARKGQIIHRKERLLKQLTDSKGYLYVRLYNDKGFKNIKVHRLVANNFLENPNNLPQVNHIDGCKQNNNIFNLEFCTELDNVRHSIKNGLVDLELRKANMSKLGKSKRALMKRWHPEQFKSMEYKVGGNSE